MRWIYAVVLLALLAWGLEQVEVSPLETGDVYPPYSSLRSDPLGAKALYESFAALPGIQVERLYHDRDSLEGPRETMFVLGVDPVSFDDVSAEELEHFEKLVQGGGRLVIAFLPVHFHDVAEEKRPIAERWHLQMLYLGEIRTAGSAMPRATALYFQSGPEWRAIGRHNAIERNFGRGSMVLVADSFPLSNEGLREARDAAFLADLTGPATRIVFDENHFGVSETGSVTTLMRKYHLEGAVAVLALAAALFLWRSTSSFLPPRESEAAQAVTGRDAIEGMTALLIRGVPQKDLLNACFAEWNRSSTRESARRGRREPDSRPARSGGSVSRGV